ncbi:MAG TPA: substrate-binding domain-containing protein [Acidobacteriaceae bacterium]|nr:substrate-binding domain-containing protein [Acidobacteriaceae bacterium]
MEKKVVLVTLAVVLPMFVGGCERHSKSEQYFLVATNIRLPYWQSAHAGFTKAAAEYGVTEDMRGPDTFTPAIEVDEFRAAVARKPAGILVSVSDPNLMGPEINKAIAAGIPVITVDSDAPASQRLFFIGTNNLEAGRLGGQRVAAQLNGKGNVVFFSMPGQPNLDERLKGYKDVFANFPGIKIVEVFDMKGESGTAMDKAEEYLGRTGASKINAFICLEASAGKDVGEAFKRAKTQDAMLMAMDVDQATLELVKDGTIQATISQKPFTMAFLGLKALDELHHYPLKPLNEDWGSDARSPVPAFIDTGVSLVDKSNVDRFLATAPGTS